VLPAEELHLRIAVTGLCGKVQMPARLKISVVLERQLDSNGTIETLRTGDSGNG